MKAQDRSRPVGAVLIADDHEVTRFGLAQLVRSDLGATRVIEAQQFEAALERITERDLGLAIIDLGMPGLSNSQELAKIRRIRPDVKLVVLSASDRREDIVGCLAAGVHGYLIKTEGLEDLVERLRYVLGGEIYVPPGLAELDAESEQAARPPQAASPPPADALGRLTPRQVKVLRCLAMGMTNKEIARRLAITDRTVKMHLSTIYPILGVHNRTQAASIARGLPREAAGADADEEPAAREAKPATSSPE